MKFRVSLYVVVEVEAEDKADAIETASSLVESVPDYRIEEGSISVEDVIDTKEQGK